MLIAAPLTGCSGDDESEDLSGAKIENAKSSKLISGLESAFDDLFSRTGEDFANGGYIVYSAEDAQFVVLSEREFSIASTLSEFMESGSKEFEFNSKNLKKAPAGDGWKYAGKCAGNKFAKAKMAYKIGQMIPADKSFEIHAEVQTDGSYKIWYRII